MLELVLHKASWLAAATGLGILAVIALAVRHRKNSLPVRTRAAVGYSLFFGLWIAVLGTGHLVAVTTGAFLGSLSPHIQMQFVIPFGLALTLPGWLLLASVPGIWSGQPGNCRVALATYAFCVLLLLWNAPLVAAFPALGFLLVFQTRKDWGIHLDERTLDGIRSAMSGAVTTAFSREEKRP